MAIKITLSQSIYGHDLQNITVISEHPFAVALSYSIFSICYFLKTVKHNFPHNGSVSKTWLAHRDQPLFSNFTRFMPYGVTGLPELYPATVGRKGGVHPRQTDSLLQGHDRASMDPVDPMFQ